MSSDLYSISIPVFQQMLGSLSSILDKAAAYGEARKVKDEVLTGTRLVPDMLSFARQIQIACDHAKNGPSRIAGVEPPRFEDTEVTIAELKERIAKTLDYLKTIDPEALNAGAERTIQFGVGPSAKAQMVGADYLRHWVIPNFFFHTTTAYAILRNAGLTIGKQDYLGAVPGFAWV